MSKRYSCRIRTVGNPDYNQNPHRAYSPAKTISADTLAELSQMAQDYIRQNDVGGGNWCEQAVRCDGREVGRLAYNGKVFGPGKWDINTPTVYNPCVKAAS